MSKRSTRNRTIKAPSRMNEYVSSFPNQTRKPNDKRSNSPELVIEKEYNNNDHCDCCGQCGNLVCCDGCPCSFHYECLDPPINDISDIGDWYCRKCQFERGSAVPKTKYQAQSKFMAPLFESLISLNPKQFQIPSSFRRSNTESSKIADIQRHEMLYMLKNPELATLRYTPVLEKSRKRSRSFLERCAVCNLSENLITCSLCLKNYHSYCLSPPIIGNQPNWTCPDHDLSNGTGINTKSSNQFPTHYSYHKNNSHGPTMAVPDISSTNKKKKNYPQRKKAFSHLSLKQREDYLNQSTAEMEDICLKILHERLQIFSPNQSVPPVIVCKSIMKELGSEFIHFLAWQRIMQLLEHTPYQMSKKSEGTSVKTRNYSDEFDVYDNNGDGKKLLKYDINKNKTKKREAVRSSKKNAKRIIKRSSLRRDSDSDEDYDIDLNNKEDDSYAYDRNSTSNGESDKDVNSHENGADEDSELYTDDESTDGHYVKSFKTSSKLQKKILSSKKDFERKSTKNEYQDSERRKNQRKRRVGTLRNKTREQTYKRVRRRSRVDDNNNNNLLIEYDPNLTVNGQPEHTEIKFNDSIVSRLDEKISQKLWKSTTNTTGPIPAIIEDPFNPNHHQDSLDSDSKQDYKTAETSTPDDSTEAGMEPYEDVLTAFSVEGRGQNGIPIRIEKKLPFNGFSIGRSNPELDIDLGSYTSVKTISHKHASIVFNINTSQYELINHGRNGSRLNGELFGKDGIDNKRTLKHGDVIEIGKVELKFLLPQKKK